MLDWDHLRIFLAVARHGQLLAAARRLGLNHATVARRLDALEAALGAPLFERRPTGCVPTQAGERLLPAAERIEAEMIGIAERLKQEAGEVSGTVRIGAPDGLGNYFLAAELARLAARHPGLEVELVPQPRAFSLSRREADLAIVLDRPTQGRLLVSRLTDYTLGLYAARAYLERAGVPETVEALAGHAVVTGVEDLAYASALDYAALLETHGGRRFRCAGVTGQMEAVRAGAGIGVLHDFAVAVQGAAQVATQVAAQREGVTTGRGKAKGRALGRDALQGDALVRVLPQVAFRRSYFLLAHPDTAGVRRIAALRDFLARRFREARARFIAG